MRPTFLHWPCSSPSVCALALLLAGIPSLSRGGEVAGLPAGRESHFAPFGTNRVHYLAQGHGTQTLLFVHGWACNAGFWRAQIPSFADHARVIAVDLPGHGQSDKPERTYSLDFFADAVLAVLRDAQEDRAALIGHSMGTPVICRVYAKAPEKVTALVAVDGMLRRPKLDAANAQKFIDTFSGPDYRNQATQFVRAMFPDPGTAVLRERVVVEMLATPQHVMSSAMAAMFDTRQPTWDLPKLEVPVLVINTASPMWTSEYKEYVGSLSKQTDYRTIEGAGHFLMLEKPAEFNATLKVLLRKFQLISG